MKLASGLTVFTVVFALFFLVSQSAAFTNATSLIGEKKEAVSLIGDGLFSFWPKKT
jgi:hypothetical protein